MTTADTAQHMVPLREGMFEMPDTIEGTPKLFGQRCTACKEVFNTTERVYCANCSEEALERITLGARGTVFSYTIVRQQLPGALVQAPYVMARVRLPEGVTVQTIITDVELEEVTIGMAVEICLKQLTEDDEQRAVVNFFFRPAKA